MNILLLLLVVGGTFLLCYLLDRGFTKVFRNKPQHESGRAVRLNKKYGAAGLVLAVLGVAAIFNGIGKMRVLTFGGAVLIVVGVGLIVYYLSFGVFYDDDSFVLTTFGKKSQTYAYRQIKAQQLYNSYGNILIELHLEDGRTLQLQAGMVGVYPFLDTAFSGWLKQTGKRKEDCGFYDPDNSCWFPAMED